ncbi:hypothetical protein OG520_00635 [Streptomyces sp. NBC_00984]|uniref:hypothetical protein n=1 Tax=Streptomyces sp. NBC_00984 TaxID=2903700 RepID=UPI0038661351|nr:hypothetical protein OG520_00635 [Streptomyces sp. NBC_00984]
MHSRRLGSDTDVHRLQRPGLVQREQSRTIACRASARSREGEDSDIAREAADDNPAPSPGSGVAVAGDEG